MVSSTESALSPFEQFKAYTARFARLQQVAGLLGWDQQTYLPPGASAARAEQLATLSELIHQIATSEEFGTLLSRAETEAAGMAEDSVEIRMLRVSRREFDRATKLPAEFVAESARHRTLAMDIWHTARETNNFVMFVPALQKMIDLTRRFAGYLGYKKHPYDALIDVYEPGSTCAAVGAMFADLTPHLVDLTAAIKARRQVDDGILHAKFPMHSQRELTLAVVRSLGYDLNRGRQDEAPHPFCSGFSRDDVRITTRFDETFLQQALYASLHEAGHAMYEQGISAEYAATPLGEACSLGIHESQSRLWENQVGRSRAFANYVFPMVKRMFPSIPDQATAETYYRAVNKVEPSLIRVEADEVTYNLHVAIRFELECALLTGDIAVKDLPTAWNAKMQRYLGITPPDDAGGVLQDVHWSIGLIGYFPTYSIGNLVSAQLWHTIQKAMPNLTADIESGEFAPLLAWLNRNVHVHGARYLPDELVKLATGEPLTASYYVRYLDSKFRELYSI